MNCIWKAVVMPNNLAILYKNTSLLVAAKLTLVRKRDKIRE
jgi:hypothetical protein